MSRFAYILCVGFLLAAAEDISDFDIKYHGYEFIYHDDTDLVLVIHEDSCFFVHAGDAEFEHVLTTRRGQVESDMVSLISQHKVVKSSLEEVRDKFADRLADFHCLTKTIYIIPVHVRANV